MKAGLGLTPIGFVMHGARQFCSNFPPLGVASFVLAAERLSGGCTCSTTRPLKVRDEADPFSMDLGVTEKGDLVKVLEVRRRRFVGGERLFLHAARGSFYRYAALPKSAQFFQQSGGERGRERGADWCPGVLG